ncbi:MAG: nucleotidyl transferase AbiEii/AbiGii toxin family protein [Melioribacteraceae bacterium]
MQDLQDLEKLEIDVLELLNSIKIIDYLYFGGGTLLRLCHNLNRYSTDLDFWLDESVDSKIIFKKLKTALSEKYSLLDSANKHNTLLFQFRSSNAKRSLKIEIRKEQSNFDWEKKIAYSKFSNKQILVNGLTLTQMMNNKIEAALSRKIIRDIYDIQFLIMRGEKLPSDVDKLNKILEIIKSFKLRDFKVTLGSLLEKIEREFYVQNKFTLLQEEINNQLILLK